MRALIVEDNFTNRKILQRFLKDISETDIAVDGVEAVAAFKTALDEKAPYDVIFLDIMMPNKDGMEVLREIRQYEQELGIMGLDGVKVIMTSALEGNHDILNAFKAGCEAYIVKPYTRSDINSKLAELGCLHEVS
ncbi:MAG TPA: response regulator [Caldithrix abyssi]|uniref:Response regulator n=1 Tax=Caldithrix abyssi TaxID=187145 RepID=A0A7V1LK83_CALAY|nr:response regulator [Caldithrix abyssi]